MKPIETKQTQMNETQKSEHNQTNEMKLNMQD